MSAVATAGATLLCSSGTSPSLLNVPNPKLFVGNRGAATVGDAQPLVNIAPFGLCKSPANPVVAAATAAAMGVLTPMPCVPATASWVPGLPTVLAGSLPLVTTTCVCPCKWAGTIAIAAPGQSSTTAP